MTKVKFNTKGIEAKIEKYKRVAKPKVAAMLKEEIIREIEGGRSPVKGQKRFVKYSSSYLNAIARGRYSNKRKSPVNLKLTGKLLGSIFTKNTKNGIEVGFDDPLADIHNNQGAGKSKTVRRMLPTEKGEQFNRSITLRLKEVLTSVARNIFK